MSRPPNLQLNPEIDFVHLAKTIWQRRMLIVKTTGIAAALGFLLTFLSPVRYTASTTMVQEISDPKITLNEAKLAAISALAAVAGVDLNGLTKAKMSAQTFAKILSSAPFRRELMNTKLNFGRTDTATTLFDYYLKTGQDHSLTSFVTDIPSRLLDDSKGAAETRNSTSNARDIPQLTPEEIAVNQILDKQITIQVLDDEYITIRCTLSEALAAAQLTKRAGELLQHYLTDIQTEKPSSNLQFIQERHDLAKSNFLKIQNDLIAFQTGNKQAETSESKSARAVNIPAVVKSTIPDKTPIAAKSDEHSLSAEYRLAEKIYSDLATKLEQSKIALNEQTPVFRIVDPVTVPTEKSAPNRSKSTLIFGFFGFVLAMILILGKDFFEDTREKWRKN
jgi:capsular polysaccharide biosynthesis protein